MEDPATPWVIAELSVTKMSERWAWTVLVLGVAFVLMGAVLFSSV
ncbi:MAG: hypothetical protein PGN37_23425 [Mycobacterium kyogaense]